MNKIVVILLLCLLPLFCKAQLIACHNVIPNNYNFWLYLPEDFATAPEKKPVILFLHGRSLSGDDLSLVRRYGCIDALLRGRKIDAIVIAPQSKTGWKPEKLMELYNWVTTNYRSDITRFYVLGMSMGGFGTLDFVATYPEKVAAAMAMCGGSNVNSLCGLNEVPLWIIHGMADVAVPVNQSERVVDSMCLCGDTSRLIFNKLKSVNHSSPVGVFYLQQTYDWLFSHALTDSLRPTNKDYSISKELLNAAYNDLENKSDIQIVDLQSYKDSQKQYYVVKKGDTLSSIAVENNSTVSILCKLNNIKKDTKLWPGRKIRVK